MKKIIFTLILIVVCIGVVYSSTPFTAGNLVVYRVGDGSAALTNTATKLFLDEYSLNHDGLGVTLVQSVPVMLDETKQMMALGTGSAEGWMTRSNCGRYLLIPGYNVNAGSSVTAGNVIRVAAVVDAQGTIDARIQSPDIAPGSNFCSVASFDGTGVWMVGYGGTTDGGFYYADRTSETPTVIGLGPIPSPIGGSTQQSMRFARIFNGKLYLIRNTFVWGIDGLPTTPLGWNTAASASANIEAFYSSGQKNYDMFFADLDPLNPGEKLVAYVTMTADGLTKYSKVDGAWVKHNTKNVIVNGRSIEGKVENGIVTLYIAASSSSTSGSDAYLYKFVDNAGHNANFPETGSVTQLLSMGSNNKTIRSVAWAPELNSILTTKSIESLPTLKVYKKNNSLIVEKDSQDSVEVYSLLGVKIKNIKSMSSEVTIEGLEKNQLYLIKVGKQTAKILF